jgi:arylsulfatase A-like enzyme
MDEQIGRVLDWLEANNLRDNTLIIFTSDNGMNMGHHGVYGKGNGTLPQNMYDTSVKVPMLMSHPASMPQNVVCEHLLSHYDFMPTLLDYLGLPSPLQNLPGQSFASLLRGEPLSQRENVVVYDEYGPVRMIRTKDWKYVHRYPKGPHELYHLTGDPDEEQNLINHPEHQSDLEELRSGLEDWFERYVVPSRDGKYAAATGMGQLGPFNTASQHNVFPYDWYYLKDKTESGNSSSS